MQFYASRNGQAAGPLSPEAVLALIRQGKLTGEDELWLEGSPHSLRVSEVLGWTAATETDPARLARLALRSGTGRQQSGFSRGEALGKLALSVLSCLPAIVIFVGLVALTVPPLVGIWQLVKGLFSPP